MVDGVLKYAIQLSHRKHTLVQAPGRAKQSALGRVQTAKSDDCGGDYGPRKSVEFGEELM